MSEHNDIQKIDITLIQENENALRAVKRDSESYKGLVASIRLKGFIGTITVRPITVMVNGVAVAKYELLDGLHRFNACKDLGINPIPCFVKQMDKSEVLQWQMMANHHKIETKPAEYAQQLQRMIAMNPALTLTEIGASLGISTATIENRLGLLKLAEPIQKLVDDGKITLSNAIVLCKLPETEQLEFVDFAMTQSPKDFSTNVNNRKKQLAEAKRTGTVAAPPSFVPTPVLRNKADLEVEFAKPTTILALVDKAGVSSVADVIKIALGFALSVDVDTIAAKKAQWDQREAEKKAAKEKRDAEKAAKKQAEATVTAAAVAA